MARAGASSQAAREWHSHFVRSVATAVVILALVVILVWTVYANVSG